MKRFVLSIAVALTIGACVEKRGNEPSDSQLLEQIKLKRPPTPQHPLDIIFEGKIRLLGYDIERSPAVPDQPFKLTWYWRVDRTLGEDWQLFTHVADSQNRNRLNLDSDRPVRRVYPASEWKAGDLLKDSQEVTLPKNWGSDIAIFYVGFYSGPHRLHVTQGPSDNDNRAEALRLPVAVAAAPAPKPLVRLVARHATGKITLDGKLDEPDWQAAQPTGPLVNPMTGDLGGFVAQARVVYDAERLYVGFDVQDDYLKSDFKKNDDHLWEQDTVEVMIDPDGDAKNYFEIQVSPRGVSFDTRYDAPRDPQPFGHVDWSSQVQSKQHVDGTLDDDTADKGYTVELSMPWSAFAVGATPAAPPVADTTWRMNFFVMDTRKQGQRAVAWSAPLVGDFHTLDRFGRVVFAEAANGTHAPAATSTVPAAAPVTQAKKLK